MRKPLKKGARPHDVPNPFLKIAALAGGILLLSLDVSAQRISAGVVGGGSLTHGFRDLTFFDVFLPEPPPGHPPFPVGTRYWSPSKDCVAGGMLEVRFNPHWSLEVNGLFRQLNGKWAAVLVDGSLNSVSPHPVVTWQFPVLAKYRFQSWKVNPFFEAGPSFRTAGNLNSSDPSHHGITAGMGFEVYWRRLKIAPAVRYTLWAGDKYRSTYRSTGAQTAPDQVEILVGFSREGESNWRPLGRHISLGVTLGTNLTGDFRRTTEQIGVPPGTAGTSSVFSGPRSFIVGSTAEVHLPYRLSVEVDALYRPISLAGEVIYADGTRQQGCTGRFVTWEFPVLAKYRFPVRGPAPFIALGPSFRLLQSLTGASPYGIAAAAGLEIQVRHMKITPAVRYTHWALDKPRAFGWPARNQSEVLVGFTF